MSSSGTPRRRRVPPPVPSNSLILVLPSSQFFQNPLKDLFKLHFSTYGTMLSWSPLENLGRCLIVYQDLEGAKAAKEEMDGFVWEEDDDGDDGGEEATKVEQNESSSTTGKDSIDENGTDKSSLPTFTLPAIRVYFGPSISTSLLSLSSPTPTDYLSVPSLEKNFLISPPGSPPVGWEQVLEDAPNTKVHSEDWEGDVQDDSPSSESRKKEEEADEGALGKGGLDELKRALRFLSVGEEDDDPASSSSSYAKESQDKTVISSSSLKPSVVISTPPQPPLLSESPPSNDSPKKGSITNVKATVESMLGGFGAEDGSGGSLGMQGGTTRFVPTARPPPAPASS